jgi:hypothetical protein
MPCSFVKLPGGGTAIVKHSAPRRKRCRWCQQTAANLCDFEVGKTLGGAPITCDAPMCFEHSTDSSGNRHRCPTHALADIGKTPEPVRRPEEPKLTWPATRDEMIAAGYLKSFERACKLCGRSLEFWKKGLAGKDGPFELQIDGRLISHFATCPEAAKFRKRRR